MNKFKQGLADHNIVGQVDEKITQEEKNENRPGDDGMFPRPRLYQGAGLGMKEKQDKCQEEEGKAFDTSESEERSGQEDGCVA